MRYNKPGLTIRCRNAAIAKGGQMLAAVALLKKKPKPTDQDIDAAMTHICRCGTYARMRTAIHAAARQAGGKA